MTKPTWPTCQAAPNCAGVRVEPGATCLRHLPPQDRARVLSDLGPGADVDVRGVGFDNELFGELLAAVTAPGSGPPRFGVARFDGASFFLDVKFSATEFSADCSFSGARFSGAARFSCTFGRAVRFGPSESFRAAATFAGPALFDEVRFNGAAHFGGLSLLGPVLESTRAVQSQQARLLRSVTPGVEFKDHVAFERCEFGGVASWQGVTFDQAARFDQATFEGNALFSESKFAGAASFEATQFRAYTRFAGAAFNTDPNFAGAMFDRADFQDVTFSAPGGTLLGPCTARELDLSGARSLAPLTVQCGGLEKITADKLQSAGTLNLQLDGTIKIDASAIRSARELTLTYQDRSLTLVDAAFDTPATISSTEYLRPRVLLLQKVDATNLTLAGLYLNACRFKDCHNRDKLRIEGPLGFSRTPTKRLWTNRRALAEEHEWRARYDRRPRGWFPEWTRHPDEDLPEPAKPSRKSDTTQEQAAQVQSIYRDLRKGREDAKDEPGAADFYFGEMEMRRMAAPRWSWERVLLSAYWAFSGYGLRASRALIALVLVLVLGTVGYATVGFAPSAQTVYQPVTSTQPITYRQISAPGPKPGWAAAIDQSVDGATALLRASTPRTLTGTGRVIEVLLRLLGPLLLGLAVLALRSRVKR